MDFLNFKVNQKASLVSYWLKNARESKEFIYDQDFRITKHGLLNKFEKEVYEDKKVDDVVGIKPIDDEAR